MQNLCKAKHFFHSTRLETLFKNVYASHNIVTSRTLIDRFKRTIPKSTRSVLDNLALTHTQSFREVLGLEIYK